MKLTTLALRGIGPFRDETRIDFREISGRLIAVTGPNGAGKSTLLECVLGAIDRTTPTRGRLTDLATARDAFVELGVGDVTITQRVDGVSGKGETLVTNGTGAPVLADAKVSTFDAWRKEALPPTSVLLTTVFSAQGSGGFLALSTSERKGTLLRTLGIEGIEKYAERARQNARDARARLEAHVERVKGERERATPVDEAEVDVDFARNVATGAEAQLILRKGELADARRQHSALVEAFENAEAARAAKHEAREKCADAELAVRDAQGRHLATKGALVGSDEIRAEAAGVIALRERLDHLREDLSAAKTRVAETDMEMRATHDDEKRSLEEYGAAKRRADSAESARTSMARCREQEARVLGLETEAHDAERARDRAADALTEAEHRTAAGLDERVRGLRGGLLGISSGVAADPVATATTTLDEDDARAASVVEVRAQIQAAREAKDQAHRRFTEADFALQEAKRVAARIPDLEAAVAAGAEAEREMVAARGAQEEAAARRRPIQLRLGLQRNSVGELETQASATTVDLRKAEVAAARIPEIDRAEARLEEIEQAVATANRAHAAARAAYDALPDPPDAAPVPDVRAQESAVETAEGRARDAASTVAVASQALEAARSAAARIDALETEQLVIQEDLADWTRLGADLGPRGLQAFEIDAVGPEISTIATSLLHECFGPRWTVSLTTTRPSADGKREIECFDVQVLDTERGRDGEADGLSGGEKVIVGEAVSLALTTVACRRAGLDSPTLVRDESGAALDPERARAYVAMLRRAAELIGAERVLLVSHTPEVQELCDARIEILDGHLSVA